MSLEWRARSSSLAWSNPLAWWWSLLTLVSGVNIAVWFVLYRQLHEQPTGGLGSSSGIELMLAALRGLCVRLRLQVVPAARGCAADLPVRHLAVERRRRPVGGNRGRGLLRGAVGDHPAPARHHDGSGHHRERRVGDRAADPDRGMLLMVCGADHQLSGQRHREFDLGRCLLHRRDRALPAAAGIRWRGPRRPRRRDRRDCGLSGVSHDRRRPDVSEPVADRGCRRRQASAARSRASAT